MFEIVIREGSEFRVLHFELGDPPLWGVGDPPGWVWVGSEGVVHYFPVNMVHSVRVPVRPVDSDGIPISAD